MVKFHITKTGLALPCEKRETCHLGVANHFNSLEEARASVFEPHASRDRRLTVERQWREFLLLPQDSKAPKKHRAELFEGFLKSLERDPRARGISAFRSGDDHLNLSGLSKREFEQLKEAHEKPLRITGTEQAKIDERLREYRVARLDVEAYAAGRILRPPKWRGEAHYFHPTREVAFFDPENIVEAYAAVAAGLRHAVSLGKYALPYE